MGFFSLMRTGLGMIQKTIIAFPKTFIISNETSYYPEKERKSYLHRVVDNVWWTLKYHEANSFYMLYGFDLKGCTYKQMDTYMDYLHFMRSRDVMNKVGETDCQIALLRDKFLFYKYMKSNGISVPEVFAVINDGHILSDNLENKPLDFLRNENDYFIKDITGECANFVKRVKDFDNYKEIASFVRKGRFIVQKSLSQCTKMNMLNPSAINTLRIVTMMNDNGRIDLFSSLLRVGCLKTGNVDNWAAGGVAVGVEEDGHLKQYGFYKPGYGTKSDVHPDTQIVFKEFVVPFYREAVELAKRAHSVMYGVKSIGWDIAITESGPSIIEGNDNWEISLMQVGSEGLRKKWKIYQKRGNQAE